MGEQVATPSSIKRTMDTSMSQYMVGYIDGGEQLVRSMGGRINFAKDAIKRTMVKREIYKKATDNKETVERQRRATRTAKEGKESTTAERERQQKLNDAMQAISMMEGRMERARRNLRAAETVYGS